LLADVRCARDAGPAAEPSADTPAAIQVQRVKPDRPKLPMLRFLNANRDYLRAELDRLRPKLVGVRGGAGVIDLASCATAR
jgi:hypothetical protein